MSSSPTCNLCGETVAGISQTGGTVRFEPCGHSVPEDEKKHWLKKESEAVEDTYVPEDVAARDAVDRGETTPQLQDQLQELLGYCKLWQDDRAYLDVADRLGKILADNYAARPERT